MCIVFDRTIPAMSQPACLFFLLPKLVNRVLSNVCGFYPFFLLFFFSLLSFCFWCVWRDGKKKNHPISIPLLHCCFSPLHSLHHRFPPSVNPPIFSLLIASLCGCVWSGLFPPGLSPSSSSPSFHGEGAYALGA